jgi:hypothetical protein
MANSSKMVISLGLGLLVGLLMVFIRFGSLPDSLLAWHEGTIVTYQFVHYPARIVVFNWGRLGLPFPSGALGELQLLRYAILIQWVLLGALGGLVWQWVSRHKARQKDA